MLELQMDYSKNTIFRRQNIQEERLQLGGMMIFNINSY